MHADFGAKAAPVNPRNYFVPDFGVDEDIKNVSTSINNTEKRMGKTMSADWGATANPLNPRGYFVPDFGLDVDIKSSLSNLKLEEGLHGKWIVPGSQQALAEADASKAEEKANTEAGAQIEAAQLAVKTKVEQAVANGQDAGAAKAEGDAQVEAVKKSTDLVINAAKAEG